MQVRNSRMQVRRASMKLINQKPGLDKEVEELQERGQKYYEVADEGDISLAVERADIYSCIVRGRYNIVC